MHGAVGSCTWIKTPVHLAVRIKPADIGPAKPKRPRHQNLPVGLHRQRKDIPTDLRPEGRGNTEISVPRTVRVQPSNPWSSLRVHIKKVAANEDLSIWLQGGSP